MRAADDNVLARALRGEWLSVDEAVSATVGLDLIHIGFKAFDVAWWPFRPRPLRLKKKYRS